MKLLPLFLFCSVVATQSTPISNSTGVTTVARMDLDLVAGLKVLIMDLYRNLSDTVDQAKNSIDTFTSGVENEFNNFLGRVETRIDSLRQSVEDLVNSLLDKVSEVGDEVKSCVDENAEKGEDLFKETIESVKECGNGRVEAISEMITSLVVETENASVYIQEVLAEVDTCYNTTGNEVISLAHCLGLVVINAELKVTGFLAQTGYQVWRINLSLAALPASLEMCAGAGLINIGADTGKVISGIGSCLASTAYELISSNSTDSEDWFSKLFNVPKV